MCGGGYGVGVREEGRGGNIFCGIYQISYLVSLEVVSIYSIYTEMQTCTKYAPTSESF